MTTRHTELTAMRRALELAATPGFALHGNPRVGCVLVAPDGTLVAEGYHRGAGTPHAEADALAQAGESARGATAVVTLEPCNHTGRTGPCAGALVEAGVARVVFAQSDTTDEAHGGAAALEAAGIEVSSGLLADESAELNRFWNAAMDLGRPVVTWKFAASLDGRSAAADGTSQWITPEVARRDVHAQRALADTMLVGTGTALADDPALTVRDDSGAPVGVQPLRAVMGLRELPATARVLDQTAPSMQLHTRDPHAALKELFTAGSRHVFLEGGPHLAAAFLQAGLVDRVVAYVAPVLLGAGTSAVTDFGVATLADALRITPEDLTILGSDQPDRADQACVRIIGTPERKQ